MGNPYAPPGENQRPPQQPPAPQGWPPPGAPQGWPAPGAPQDRPPHGAPPEGGPGTQRHAAPPPDSEIVRTTSRRVLHFLAFLLASVLTSALPLPWQLGSLAFVVVGIVVGVRALALAWQGGVRGGLVAMLGVGVALACFVALGMLSLLAFWPQQLERQECLAGAVTISATRTCESDFRRALDDRLGRTAPAGTATPRTGA